MAVTADLVQRWIAADKLPVRQGVVSMKWEVENGVARWKCALASGGIGRGSVMCMVKRVPPETWHFVLVLRGTDVLRWDIDSRQRVSHRNVGCPPSFPPRVHEPHHEHQWVDGRGTSCALPLTHRARDTHRQVWEAFAARANIRGTIHYAAPTDVGEALRLFP